MTEDLSVLTRRANPPDATLSYGPDPDQVADVRYAHRGEQRPLVVLIHGGFWKPEYDRAHAEAMSTALMEAGWTVLTLEYRRIPGSPDATLQDVATAIATLPARVDRQSGTVLLIGHSAGGHLALWAAAAAPNGVGGVVALAPAADLQLAHALGLGDGAVARFLGTDPAARPDADPRQLPPPAAPVTIIQGEADAIVPPALARSYGSACPAARLVLLPDTGHFAVIDPASAAWPTVVAELERLSRRR